MRHRMYRKVHQPGLEKSLIKSIASSGKIVTTLHRAKHIRPFVEKLITSARKANASGTLSDHRLLRSRVDEQTYKNLLRISKNVNPNGGYTRIIKLSKPRKGDLVKRAVMQIINVEPKEGSRVEQQ